MVEGLASEVRGGQKQFKLLEDSAKHSELLIPNLIFTALRYGPFGI